MRLSDKKIKIIISIAAVLVIAVCFAVVAGIVIGKNNPENGKVIVYRKNNTDVIRINDKELTVNLENTSEYKCDKKSGRVFFTAESSYSNGLYDLYFVEEKSGEITSPKLIDYAIEKNFSLASGKVYYLKFNNKASANDACVCDVDKNKIEVFAENVDSIYTLDGAESIYFIKMHGITQVLYEYNGSSPIELSRNIINIFSYESEKNPHILFEKKSSADDNSKQLYVAFPGEQPNLICDNVSEVLYDNYKAGGNLYYFSTSEESVSWSYVIADGYEETDLTMKRPVRSDFFSFFGISAEYNEALRKYQDKLVRDEIRQALNIMTENGEFSAPVYSAFAYNENGTFKIAENIDPTRVFTVSTYGEPKIIFEEIKVSEAQSDMDSLVSIAQRSTMSEVLEYARSIVANSIVSNGVEVAVYSEDNGNPVISELYDYDKTKTLFSFSDNGERIYALERGSQTGKLTLYSNAIGSDFKASERVSVSSDVSSYWINENNIIYMKSDIGKEIGDIYIFDGDVSSKISNAANAFMLSEDGVFIIKNNNNEYSEPVASYFYYNKGSETEISKNVIVSSFAHKKGSAAFITTDKKELFVFEDGKTGLISDSVDEILFFS